MNSITYKTATSSDIKQIANLMVKLHEDLTIEEAVVEAKYFLEKDVLIVASDKDKIVAYTHGAIRHDYVEGSLQYKNPKAGYIESLYVLEAYRKQGIAKKLCKLLEEWVVKQGATELASDAYATNHASIAFHKAIGLEATEPIIHFIKQLKGEEAK